MNYFIWPEKTEAIIYLLNEEQIKKKLEEEQIKKTSTVFDQSPPSAKATKTLPVPGDRSNDPIPQLLAAVIEDQAE